MKFWDITVKDLKILAKDRGAMIMLFMVPFVVMTIAGFALSGQYHSKPGGIRVPFVDLDKSDVSLSLEKSLKEMMAFTLVDSVQGGKTPRLITEADAREILESGDRSAAILIPKGFGAKVKSGEQAELIVLRDPGNQITPNIVASVLDGIAVRMSGSSIAVRVATEEVMKATRGKADPAAVADAALGRSRELWEKPPINIRRVDVVKVAGKEMDPFKQTVPGFAVMFALFVMLRGGGTLLEEKEQGTFRRLLVAPVSKTSILVGKLVPSFITVIVQMVAFFVFGHFAFHMDLGNSYAGLAVMAVAVALAGTSMGVFMASIAKTEAQLSSISVLIILAMSSLGGSWWPLDIVPDFMRTLAHVVTINAWAMDGFKDVLWYGRGVVDVFPEAGVLVGISVVTMGIGVWRFRLN